uniref:Uncharacterized protein n=1 Tax=mine drainage metagenome TaxID=410659 RepID=E6QXF4_9ZZZZ
MSVTRFYFLFSHEIYAKSGLDVLFHTVIME